jgi:hypothetical protein
MGEHARLKTCCCMIGATPPHFFQRVDVHRLCSLLIKGALYSRCTYGIVILSARRVEFQRISQIVIEIGRGVTATGWSARRWEWSG